MQQLDDRASLRDLDGLRVEVLPLPAQVTARGLSTDAVRDAAESQLRRAGVRLLAMGEFSTGDPHLQITVLVSDARNGLVAFNVQVGFVQITFMRRNPLVTLNRAVTWVAQGGLSLGPVAHLLERVRQELSRQVAQFILDYQEANRRA